MKALPNNETLLLSIKSHPLIRTQPSLSMTLKNIHLSVYHDDDVNLESLNILILLLRGSVENNIRLTMSSACVHELAAWFPLHIMNFTLIRPHTGCVMGERGGCSWKNTFFCEISNLVFFMSNRDYHFLPYFENFFFSIFHNWVPPCQKARCGNSENFPLFCKHAGRGINRSRWGWLHRSQIIIHGPSLGFLYLSWAGRKHGRKLSCQPF